MNERIIHYNNFNYGFLIVPVLYLLIYVRYKLTYSFSTVSSIPWFQHRYVESFISFLCL